MPKRLCETTGHIEEAEPSVIGAEFILATVGRTLEFVAETPVRNACNVGIATCTVQKEHRVEGPDRGRTCRFSREKGQRSIHSLEQTTFCTDRQTARHPQGDGSGLAVPDTRLKGCNTRAMVVPLSPDWQAPYLEFLRALHECNRTIPVFSIDDIKRVSLTDWRAQTKPSGPNLALRVSAGCGNNSALAIWVQVHRVNFGPVRGRAHAAIDVHRPRCYRGRRGCFERRNSQIAYPRVLRDFSDDCQEIARIPLLRFADFVVRRPARSALQVVRDRRVKRCLTLEHSHRRQFPDLRNRGYRRRVHRVRPVRASSNFEIPGDVASPGHLPGHPTRADTECGRPRVRAVRQAVAVQSHEFPPRGRLAGVSCMRGGLTREREVWP